MFLKFSGNKVIGKYTPENNPEIIVKLHSRGSLPFQLYMQLNYNLKADLL